MPTNWIETTAMGTALDLMCFIFFFFIALAASFATLVAPAFGLTWIENVCVNYNKQRMDALKRVPSKAAFYAAFKVLAGAHCLSSGTLTLYQWPFSQRDHVDKWTSGPYMNIVYSSPCFSVLSAVLCVACVAIVVLRRSLERLGVLKERRDEASRQHPSTCTAVQTEDLKVEEAVTAGKEQDAAAAKA